jgi:hypothetical protein
VRITLIFWRARIMYISPRLSKQHDNISVVRRLFYGNLTSLAPIKTYRGLHVVPDILTWLQPNFDSLNRVNKNPQHQISRESVKWEPRWPADGWPRRTYCAISASMRTRPPIISLFHTYHLKTLFVFVHNINTYRRGRSTPPFVLKPDNRGRWNSESAVKQATN